MPIEAAAAAIGEEARETFCMDERNFREFYARTAGKLRGYLARVSGNATLADDLLQETYFRFLRSGFTGEDEAHRKNYLFRIGTNLLRDHFRSTKRKLVGLPEALPSGERMDEKVGLRSDIARVLSELKPRERELLWLAYAEGWNHKEIAETLNLKAISIRSLLFRARQRLAEKLRAQGFSSSYTMHATHTTKVTP